MLQLWFIANTILWPFLIVLGGFHLGLNVVVLALTGAAWLGMRRKVAVSSVVIVSILFLYVALSFCLALNGICKDQFPKLLITGPILTFLALVGLETGRRAENCDWIKLQKTAVWALLLAFFGFFIEMALPSRFPVQAGYRRQGEYSGLFSEPSAVAFSLFPCIAVLIVAESKKTRQQGFLALFGLVLLSRSSTLIALAVAWTLYRLVSKRKLRQAALTVLAMVSVVALASVINFDVLVAPTLARVVGVTAPGDAENTSSLVYLQGWQDAWANIVRTHGLGLGFNMMGCHPLPDVPARAVLALQGAGMEELNAQDGSILFGKIVSEAGVGGLFLYGAIIWWWIGLEKKIRETHDDAQRLAATLQAALIFCFVASSFIRSVGYFSGGMLLWITAASGACKWQRSSIQRLRAAPVPLQAKTHQNI